MISSKDPPHDLPSTVSELYTSGNVNTFEGCFPSSVGEPLEVAIARISLALGRKILRCTNVCDSHGAIYQCTILLYCLLQCYCARWFGVSCAVTWWLFYFTRGRDSGLSMCLWGVLSSGFHQTLERCIDNMKRDFFQRSFSQLHWTWKCGLLWIWNLHEICHHLCCYSFVKWSKYMYISYVLDVYTI